MNFYKQSWILDSLYIQQVYTIQTEVRAIRYSVGWFGRSYIHYHFSLGQEGNYPHFFASTHHHLYGCSNGLAASWIHQLGGWGGLTRVLGLLHLEPPYALPETPSVQLGAVKEFLVN